MKIGKYIYIAFLLLFCRYPNYALAARTDVMAAAPRSGTIDLRKQSFTDPVQLKGKAFFYWKEFLNPTSSSFHTQPIIVQFPSMWTMRAMNGKDFPAFGYGTYQLSVLLPHITEPFELTMPDTYCAYRLYLNGKLVAEDGKISSSSHGFVPHWSNKIVDVPAGSDSLTITLQVANFVHSKGGLKKAISIGRKSVMELTRRRAEAVDLLLCGCLFMGGLFFMGLYIMGNRDKAILFFSLFTVVYSYRIIGIDNYVLHTIIPGVSWYITVRLEYISLFAGIGLFGLYSRYLYPLEVNQTAAKIASGICFLFAGAVLVLPPFYFTQLIGPFLGLMLLCLVYTPYVYIRAFLHKRPGSVYALLSSLMLMGIFTIALLHYVTVIPQLQAISFLFYIGFFFLQSLVLSHRVYFALKRAREEAVQGLIAKSEFLSTMSHEIRTPLNSVVGMSHLLLQNMPRQDQREQLDVIMFSANNLLTIVNDILDYNKIEAGKITFEHIDMDIVAIGNNVVNSLKFSAHDKGINLKYTVDETLKNKIIGDPTRLTQVITNLVHNAVKFTPKGYVELIIDLKAQTETTVTLEIGVKDTGIGISPEKQKMIFDRFTQADSSTSRGFGGTGLGLAISKRLLELRGSNLQLISKEGEGSLFYFVQTFEKGGLIEAEKTVTDRVVKDEKPLQGVNLLLVDDNPMNVMVAQAFLKRWGAETDVAVNGQDALEKLDENKHNLVLMDLQMPVMDGYQAAQQIREQGITIPILALTANLPAEVAELVARAGMDDIIIKPFLPDDLFKKINKYLMAKKVLS